jgi:hypothetical protein
MIVNSLSGAVECRFLAVCCLTAIGWTRPTSVIPLTALATTLSGVQQTLTVTR